MLRVKNKRFEAFVFKCLEKLIALLLRQPAHAYCGVELATGIEPSALHHFCMLRWGNIMMITVPCIEL